jgi:hypothetical protein
LQPFSTFFPGAFRLLFAIPTNGQNGVAGGKDTSCLFLEDSSFFGAVTDKSQKSMCVFKISSSEMTYISYVMKINSYEKKGFTNVIETVSYVINFISYVTEIISHVIRNISYVIKISSCVIKTSSCEKKGFTNVIETVSYVINFISYVTEKNTYVPASKFCLFFLNTEILIS